MLKKKEESKGEHEMRVADAIRYWTNLGDPIKARDIRRAQEKGEAIDPALLNTGRVKPRPGVDMAEVGEAPPRTGRGSGVDNWREFAKATSDMDAEVIDTMTKDDIIAALVATDVIPEEEEE